MKFATTAIVAASAGSAMSAQLIGGNWYGKAVERISYTNWGAGGTYQKVSDMSNGKCEFEEVTYSGGTSPLDGEVSWHFRGPMHLKQFAFYTPGTSSKRSLKPSASQKRHGHGHQERGVADMITATINGQVVSWAHPTGNAAAPTWAPVPAYEPKEPAPAVNAGAGNWGRQAYYNAENGTADGLVFLNNMGGQGSGVFDHVWGNSLAYAASTSKSGSASPQVLGDIFLEDNVEVILYSDKPCAGDECGAYRPGTVAYHGFSGKTKLFLVEFDMPMSGKTGFNMDMPAAWMLNAAIPRTAQYSDCSCWRSGCGEWDIFEVLDSGNHRAKSTIHAGKNSGGESDYFERPVSKTIKAAIVFDGVQEMGDIIILPDDTKFDTVLQDDVVAGYSKQPLLETLSKIFKVGSFTS